MHCQKWRGTLLPRIKSEKGFTLADQLLQILVLGLTTTLLLVFSAVLADYVKNTESAEHQEFDQFWLEFTQLIHSSSQVSPHFSSCSLNIVQQTTVHRYEKVGTRIRKSKNGAGNEPMLLNVSSCTIKVDENKVVLSVELLSGETFKRETYRDVAF